MPKLIVQVPDGEEVAYEFDDALITIGRSAGNSIVIPHSSLSGLHAATDVEPRWDLHHLGSRIDQRHLCSTGNTSEAILPPYANIVFGQVSSNFYTSEPATPVRGHPPGL